MLVKTDKKIDTHLPLKKQPVSSPTNKVKHAAPPHINTDVKMTQHSTQPSAVSPTRSTFSDKTGVSAQPSMTTSIANTRAILGVFEKYQKERLHFVQTIADHASRENNIEVLQQAGVMPLLKPLLADSVPAIQQAAAVALGRLANYNEELATSIVQGNILPQLVYSLNEQNRFYKNSAAFVLRAVAKHSPQLAQAVVDSGALRALVQCLEEFDPGVKEAAAWAIGYIARHNAELAQAVVDAGTVPLLVLCVQEPELSLKRISASALSDIAKHSPELAQAVVDAQTIPIIAPYVSNNPSNNAAGSPLAGAFTDAKLKRQVLSCLSQIAKHTVDLAETVVDGEIFPGVLLCLKDPTDGYVRRNAASLVCEISKHTQELAQLIVNSGGVAAVVDYIASGAKSGARLPGIMTLGYIAAFSETLALAVIVGKAVPVLADCLSGAQVSVVSPRPVSENGHFDAAETSDEYVKAAASWSLGQLGRHSPDHAKHLTDHGVLMKLLKVLVEASEKTQSETDVNADLKLKAKRALKSILANTLDLNALEPLLQLSTPPNILKYVVAQFAKILPHDVASRRAFVTSSGLARVQEIAAVYSTTPVSSLTNGADAKAQNPFFGSKLAEYIRAINECYPEEIVRYYSPGYSAALLEKIDQYSAAQAHQQQQQVGTEEATSGSKANLAADQQPVAAENN